VNKWIISCGIVLSFCVGTCKAEPIDTLLLFGDSYFDTGAGNAVAEQIGTFLPNPTPPYFDGRHSNGPIWVDYASHLLHVGVNDFAVSGSMVGNGNFANPLLGGIFQQLDRYIAQAPFITPKTLVVLDGGGNNFFNLLTDPADLTPAGVQGAVLQAASNLGVVYTELLELGAKKTISWNLGDMGRLPIFTDPALGLTALSPLYTQISNAYNDALVQVTQMANAAAPDHQQIYIFDARAVFNEIAADLAAEGVNITEHTITTFPGGAYLVTGPQPEDLAFYDQVHPTTLVWRRFANYFAGYVDTLIDGPRFVAAEQDLAFESTRAFRDAIDNHFRTLHMERYIYGYDWDDCSCEQERFQLYAETEAKWGNTGTRRGSLGLDYDTQLVILGLDYHLSQNFTLGASFGAQTSFGRVKSHKGNILLNDYAPSVYAEYASADYFIDQNFSYHFYDFRDIHRKIPFIDREARARAEAEGAEYTIEAGYVFQCGDLTVIPIIGMDYEYLMMHRYKEKHAGMYNLAVPRYRETSLVGIFGTQMFFHGCDMGIGLLPFGEIYYEHEWQRNGVTLRPTFVNSVDNAIIYNKTSSPKRDILRYTLGVDATLATNLSGNISYEGETNFRQYNNAVKFQLDSCF
jgi:phospholipase/lecithinase/hemolysin/uncharacterized protein YhjY with autotransporter beta-barrel domain